MSTSQKIGRTARYIGAVYLLAIATVSFISEFMGLFSPNTSLISKSSIIILSFVNLFWLYAAYVLFKNLRDKFVGIIGMLLFSGVIALSLSIYQKDNLTMLAALAVVTMLIISILMSIKMESTEKKTTVDKVREVFGDHVKDLPDEDLHKMLK